MKSKVQKHQDAPITQLDKGERRIMAYSENVMPVEIRFAQGAVGSEHSHPHEQYTYIVAGKFRFTCEGQSFEVEAGDSIYFAPNEVHGTLCLEEGILLDVFAPMRQDFI